MSALDNPLPDCGRILWAASTWHAYMLIYNVLISTQNFVGEGSRSRICLWLMSLYVDEKIC